ncbi:hypothetical protein PIB30_091957, partial [Stylosanthes scabra]|nr:hypothetical protein [Stylosanthes scabra]
TLKNDEFIAPTLLHGAPTFLAKSFARSRHENGRAAQRRKSVRSYVQRLVPDNLDSEDGGL